MRRGTGEVECMDRNKGRDERYEHKANERAVCRLHMASLMVGATKNVGRVQREWRTEPISPILTGGGGGQLQRSGRLSRSMTRGSSDSGL